MFLKSIVHLHWIKQLNITGAPIWPQVIKPQQADDRYQCMKKVKVGQADVMRVDDTDIYAAGKYFGLVPILKESNSLSK